MRLALIVVLIVGWTALAIALALTRAPWSNEAWTAIPALNLATHGLMYTNVLEFRNTWLHGLDRHTYWLMPFDLLVQAVWYKIIGFGLFRQRLLSVLCAGVLLTSWFRIVGCLTGMRSAAWVVCIVIGFETNFLFGAANGRMDMMCAALGSAGIAAWLELRLSHPRVALLAGHGLTAAAIFTHPCGVLFAAALFAISLMVDRKLSVTNVLIMASPYAAAGVSWGLYIFQAPADFHSQFFGNLSGFAGEYLGRARFRGFASPGHALVDEVRVRYLTIRRPWLILSPLAALTALSIPGLRAQPGLRILLASELVVFLLMTFFEGMKFQHYLIYSLPFFAAVTGTVGARLWITYPHSRALLFGALLLLTAPQVRSVLTPIRANPLRNETGAVTDYLRANLLPGDQVIGGAELGYNLGFTDALRDDVRLGYYTGLRPRFLVTSGWYRLWFESAAQRDPALHVYIAKLLDRDYRQLFQRGEYIVYRRVDPVPSK